MLSWTPGGCKTEPPNSLTLLCSRDENMYAPSLQSGRCYCSGLKQIFPVHISWMPTFGTQPPCYEETKVLYDKDCVRFWTIAQAEVLVNIKLQTCE